MHPKPSIFTKGRLPMANRTRPNQILFFVSDDEKRIIQAKMAQLGTKNTGAYLRKMAIDGYIIKVDYTQQKKLAAAVSRAATNINHVCRRINSTGHFYEDDVAELKERQKEIWQLLKSRIRTLSTRLCKRSHKIYESQPCPQSKSSLPRMTPQLG